MYCVTVAVPTTALLSPDLYEPTDFLHLARAVMGVRLISWVRQGSDATSNACVPGQGNGQQHRTHRSWAPQRDHWFPTLYSFLILTTTAQTLLCLVLLGDECDCSQSRSSRLTPQVGKFPRFSSGCKGHRISVILYVKIRSASFELHLRVQVPGRRVFVRSLSTHGNNFLLSVFWYGSVNEKYTWRGFQLSVQFSSFGTVTLY